MKIDLTKYKKINTGAAAIDTYYYLNDDQKEELLQELKIVKTIKSFEDYADYLMENEWVISVIGALESKNDFGLYLFTNFQDYEKVREIDDQLEKPDATTQAKTNESTTPSLDLSNKEKVTHNTTQYHIDTDFAYLHALDQIVKIERSGFEKNKDEIVDNHIWLGANIEELVFDQLDQSATLVASVLDVSENQLNYTLPSIAAIDVAVRELDASTWRISDCFVPIYLYLVSCLLHSFGEEKIRFEVEALLDGTILIPKIYFEDRRIKIEDALMVFLYEEKLFQESEPLRIGIEKYFITPPHQSPSASSGSSH